VMETGVENAFSFAAGVAAGKLTESISLIF
jgi:hypothetical protein